MLIGDLRFPIHHHDYHHRDLLSTHSRIFPGNGVVVHVPDLLLEIQKNEDKGLGDIKKR